jgi:nucleobase transporter 1/2
MLMMTYMQVLLSMVVMWVLCGVLTVSGVFTDDSSKPQYLSRTDAKLVIVERTPWFQIIYPGKHLVCTGRVVSPL